MREAMDCGLNLCNLEVFFKKMTETFQIWAIRPADPTAEKSV
jgi:hypothetical protein